MYISIYSNRPYPWPLYYEAIIMHCFIMWNSDWEQGNSQPWVPRILRFHSSHWDLAQVQAAFWRVKFHRKPLFFAIQKYLLGGWKTILKNMKVNGKDYPIYYIYGMENKTCFWNHKPDTYIYKIGYPAYLPIQALLHLMESFFGDHGKHGLEAPSWNICKGQSKAKISMKASQGVSWQRMRCGGENDDARMSLDVL